MCAIPLSLLWVLGEVCLIHDIRQGFVLVNQIYMASAGLLTDTIGIRIGLVLLRDIYQRFQTHTLSSVTVIHSGPPIRNLTVTSLSKGRSSIAQEGYHRTKSTTKTTDAKPTTQTKDEKRNRKINPGHRRTISSNFSLPPKTPLLT